jgi:hypothetical protein
MKSKETATSEQVPEFSQLEWYVPGSVINALWGNIMPRLAASVWLGEVEWFPEEGSHDLDGLRVHEVKDDALERFARQLVKIGFESSRPNEEAKTEREEEPQLHFVKSYELAAERGDRLTPGQRCVLVATEYFHPVEGAKELLTNRPPDGKRMELRMIEALGYDFVLSDQGLDVFVPPKPGSRDHGRPAKVEPEDEPAAREEVLKLYKFRETSRQPIGLPRAPFTAFPPDNGKPPAPDDDSFISIPQLTAPTGSHQIPEGWITEFAEDVDWWVSGSLYRAIMEAYPRIVASKWYEEVAWDRSAYTGKGLEKTYRQRFDEPGGLKELLEERVETVLPEELGVFREQPKGAYGAKGWNPNDIMVTSKGIFFPDPREAPEWDELAKAIQAGIAGNPVFTDSVPPCA